MRASRLAVVAALLARFAITSAAGAASDPIRYAAPLKGRTLQVVLRSGATRTVRALGEGHMPVAVSADGARMTYFRAGDRALVTYPSGRRVGSIRQPRNEVGVDETTLACFGNDGSNRGRVFDAVTGKKIGSLPAPVNWHPAGFSGGGGEVLLVRSGSTTELRGRVLRRDTPPQLVGFDLPAWEGDGKVAAPAADGRRIAVYVPGQAPGLVVYDLASRQAGEKIAVRKPAAATWTGEREVTLRVDGGGRTRRVRVDVDSGASQVARRLPNPCEAGIPRGRLITVRPR
ncbi:hypothetical protein [Nonomuraea jabiensis]|uniref:WD40-like Beta Propeller Repeat n=1 Tax=Nonomuraea jabiensis TaxID=882448 RepID=A0A7W9G7L0_9ACTN|nr:hypothetical protein [Nonomuraea jabiensis]MBB5778636.1 hypothetical protein [Nonomuraea jabiensis]